MRSPIQMDRNLRILTEDANFSVLAFAFPPFLVRPQLLLRAPKNVATPIHPGYGSGRFWKNDSRKGNPPSP